jgi:hypothetical protein
MFNQLAYKGQLYRNDLFITVSSVLLLQWKKLKALPWSDLDPTKEGMSPAKIQEVKLQV